LGVLKSFVSFWHSVFDFNKTRARLLKVLFEYRLEKGNIKKGFRKQGEISLCYFVSLSNFVLVGYKRMDRVKRI